MDIYLFSVLFIFGVILLFLTFYKKQVILGVFSGIVFIILGFILWNGLSSVVGYTELVYAPCEDNCTEVRSGGEIFLSEVTTTNVTYTYGLVDNSFKDLSYSDTLGTFFIMFGLFMLIVSGVVAFDTKKRGFIDDDNQNDD